MLAAFFNFGAAWQIMLCLNCCKRAFERFCAEEYTLVLQNL